MNLFCNEALFQKLTNKFNHKGKRSEPALKLKHKVKHDSLQGWCQPSETEEGGFRQASLILDNVLKYRVQ